MIFSVMHGEGSLKCGAFITWLYALRCDTCNYSHGKHPESINIGDKTCRWRLNDRSPKLMHKPRPLPSLSTDCWVTIFSYMRQPCIEPNPSICSWQWSLVWIGGNLQDQIMHLSVIIKIPVKAFSDRIAFWKWSYFMSLICQMPAHLCMERYQVDLQNVVKMDQTVMHQSGYPWS